ncbi:Bug family tripartite tricarboxylate transporter substrate binding protein [Noviherbaspirillum saxi]|uniref:Tripartite tricarboxylate transporter substrate binding protein n=1 Tax=Noviherbaspirillum saxi TaxID=2320863 RepID=A0A3A3G6P7_9BURK|nr:tripartite tricarboxylate transporter substrate binding protein [Noviherbaspirillum saxi]RJF95860.1 tripartite tricarboxylate transporter substrate binding protein [Noviherbaspirillum saxi]
MLASHLKSIVATAIAGMALINSAAIAQDAWQPTKTLEITVAAGPGGGTDQLARLMQAVITKYKMTTVPVVVVNKGGGNGAEGFLDIKLAKGEAHKLIVGTNNAYLLPLVSKLGYNWTELTPVAAVAQDDFILWTYAEAPYKTAKEYLDTAKSDPSKYRMGGSQSKDVDQTLTLLINKVHGTKFVYIPFKSGSEAATQLAGKHISFNVNNPSENLSQWKAGQVKPLCVFSKSRMALTTKVAGDMAWSDIPTCKEQGVAIDEYRFPRTVFMPGGVTQPQIQFYTDLMRRITQTPEFNEYVERNALAAGFLDSTALKNYIAADEQRALKIFGDAGWLVK